MPQLYATSADLGPATALMVVVETPWGTEKKKTDIQ